MRKISKSKAQTKAWETMRNATAGKKASYTKKRKIGAKKGAMKVKAKQWELEKVKYLLKLKNKENTCIVCGDNRKFVIQTHHVVPNRKIIRTLCANCHDIIRRGSLNDLKNAHKIRY